MSQTTPLCYEDDPVWPIDEYDNVAVVVGEFRFPAMVKSVMPKRRLVVVSFEAIDPVLDLILLRKTAKVPHTALEFIGRGM